MTVCAEVPGDLHAKGYLYEVCKKVMTPGGFMHIVQDVLLRRKIVPESFGKMKFQQQNLSRIEEAVRDISFASGMAACIEFQKSPSFPEKSELQKCKRATGNHNEIFQQARRLLTILFADVYSIWATATDVPYSCKIWRWFQLVRLCG